MSRQKRQKIIDELNGIPPVHRWATACTFHRKGAFTSVKDALAGFNTWAAVYGHDPLDETAFDREMTAFKAFDRGEFHGTPIYRDMVAVITERLAKAEDQTSRTGKVAINSWHDPAVAQQLKMLAAERRTTQQNLIAEGLNMVLSGAAVARPRRHPRKNRTEVLSMRTSLEIKHLIIAMANTEEKSLVEIVEDAIRTRAQSIAGFLAAMNIGSEKDHDLA